MEENKTSKEAYIEGRLLGLNELIRILKDAMEENPSVEAPALIKTIVSHIAGEMDEILDEMRGTHGEHPVLKKAEKIQQTIEKAATAEITQPATAPQVLKKNVEAADDLMKNLMELRKQNIGTT